MTRRLLAAALLIAACGPGTPAAAPPAEAPPPITVPPPVPTPGRVDLPPDSAVPVPAEPSGAALGPTVRVALLRAAPEVRIAGSTGLVATDPAGSVVATAGPRADWLVERQGPGVVLRDRSGRVLARAERLGVAPRGGGVLMAEGRRYRGALDLLADGSGVILVNAVSLEAYLPSVVTAELGRRTGAEREAVLAQAIVARTYALRNLGRGRAAGYDLEAGVGDQVYGGADREDPIAVEAVRATAGVVVSWEGQPIDAFFHSTCGGRTERGVDVFRGADRSYLRSFADVDGDGLAYCRISPRFRWREE